MSAACSSGQTGQQSRSPNHSDKEFECDELEDPGRPCIIGADGSAWAVGATVVLAVDDGQPAAIGVVSNQICDEGGPRTVGYDQVDSICANVSTGPGQDIYRADGWWGGRFHTLALVSNRFLSLDSEGSPEAATSSRARAWECEEMRSFEGGEVWTGDRYELTDGTVQVFPQDGGGTVVEFDFEAAKGRLIAETCE